MYINFYKGTSTTTSYHYPTTYISAANISVIKHVNEEKKEKEVKELYFNPEDLNL